MSERAATYQAAHAELGRLRNKVVGTQYYKVEHRPGQKLYFERNPANPHDANAIEAQDERGRVLGHLPRKDAAWLAPLIDRGSIFLQGRIEEVGGDWEFTVTVSVHQHDGGPSVVEPLLPDSPGAVVHNHLLEVYRLSGTLSVATLAGLLQLYTPLLGGDGILPETRLIHALLPARLEERRRREGEGFRRLVEEYLATIDFGVPITQHGMTVVPLFRKAPKTCAYASARSAIGRKTLVVEEVDGSGQVSLLRATNSGKKPVLLPEGEGLRGAKQDRVVNISIIIAVGATVEIPVSCVERGRWAFSAQRQFEAGHYACATLRSDIKKSVHAAIRNGEGYASDQCRVWAQVDRLASMAGAASPTASYNEVVEDDRRPVRIKPEAFPRPEQACGLAIFHGNSLVSVDVFAHPKLADEVWAGMIEGAAFNVPEAAGAPPDPAAVRTALADFFRAVRDHVADPEPTPGRGSYLRSESRSHTAGILFDDQVPVHFSGFVRPAEDPDDVLIVEET